MNNQSAAVNNAYIVRAANPDNRCEAVAIANLFRKCFGEQYPQKKVYSSEFWQSNSDSAFRSVVILRGQDIVGHLALIPDSQDSGSVRIDLCAYDRREVHSPAVLLETARETLCRLAKRQNWRAVTAFTPCRFPLIQDFVGTGLGLQEIALLPAPRDGAPLHRTTHGFANPELVVVSQAGQCEADSASSSHDQTDRNALPAYLPETHSEMIEWLLSPLGLDISIAERENQNGDETTIPRSYRTSHNPAEFLSGPIDNLVQVEPDRLRPSNTSLRDLMELGPVAVTVNAHNRTCPDYCRQLERLGLRFSGILPTASGKLTLCYSQFEDGQRPSIDALTSSRGKALAHYAAQYELSRGFVVQVQRIEENSGGSAVGDSPADSFSDSVERLSRVVVPG